jgi:L-threonylcarbamoyladenylate synthase
MSENEQKITDKKQYLTINKDAVFAFPTDTVWGLGCLIDSKKAVERIYSIKHRDKRKPLILLSSKIEYLLPFTGGLPEMAKELAKRHWPGALTLVVKKSEKTPDYMTSGFDTVESESRTIKLFWIFLNTA